MDYKSHFILLLFSGLLQRFYDMFAIFVSYVVVMLLGHAYFCHVGLLVVFGVILPQQWAKLNTPVWKQLTSGGTQQYIIAGQKMQQNGAMQRETGGGKQVADAPAEPNPKEVQGTGGSCRTTHPDEMVWRTGVSWQSVGTDYWGSLLAAVNLFTRWQLV